MKYRNISFLYTRFIINPQIYTTEQLPTYGMQKKLKKIKEATSSYWPDFLQTGALTFIHHSINNYLKACLWKALNKISTLPSDYLARHVFSGYFLPTIIFFFYTRHLDTVWTCARAALFSSTILTRCGPYTGPNYWSKCCQVPAHSRSSTVPLHHRSTHSSRYLVGVCGSAQRMKIQWCA